MHYMHSVKDGRTRRGSATRAAWTIPLGLLDLLRSPVRLLFHFLRTPRRRSLALVHCPYSSVLPLLRGMLHRTCCVFHALFDRVGHIPHSHTPYDACATDLVSGHISQSGL